MKEALLRKAGIHAAMSTDASASSTVGEPVRMNDTHWMLDIEVNDYPREARWKATQKDTTSRLQYEYKTAVVLKGVYIPPGKTPSVGERKLHLHLECTSDVLLKKCALDIQRVLNEETLRVSAKSASSGTGSHKYSVL